MPYPLSARDYSATLQTADDQSYVCFTPSEPVVEHNAHRQEFGLIELIDRANHGDDMLTLLGTPHAMCDATERVNGVGTSHQIFLAGGAVYF